MSLQKFLKEFYFFKQFGPEELGAIEEISGEVQYPPDHLVFKEGDEASSMYVVEKGSVKILKPGAGGVIARIEEGGGPFGEMAFLDGGQRSAAAMTEGKTAVSKIPYTKLATLLLNRPETALKFYETAAKVLSHRLRLTTKDNEQSKNSLYQSF